jgi:hypothetical protein
MHDFTAVATFTQMSSISEHAYLYRQSLLQRGKIKQKI